MGKVDQPKIETIRHSLSHVLAMAVLDMFPGAKLAIGPDIENGFYYDFDLPRTLIPEDLPILEKKMRQIIKGNDKFEKSEKEITTALAEAKKSGQIYKSELITDLKKTGAKKVSFYTTGKFVDLCAGPHVASLNSLKNVGFKLTSIAGAYWRGDEKNKMLQRIYAVAFENQTKLDEYLKQLEEAERRDHRKLGVAMDLFSFQEAGPGFPFWHPKGMVLRNELIDYWRAEHKKAGYQEISTPIILREELWHQSGHWDNYKKNMYFTEIDGQGYAVKPMNCPGGIQVYKSKLHSYREFPIRMAELGLVHRHELSGVLHGLFRVRSFVQDDAHIYCRENQVEAELEGVIKLIEKMYKNFGFNDYHVELSTRPAKSIGTDEMWNRAEKIMKKVAKDSGLKMKLNPGDGAFYGPKFDFHIKDSIGRTWQCGTIQLDFSMPDKFSLEYIDEKGERQRPVMIHRTILGSIERFLGIFLEHYAGVLPAWAAPVQVAVITVGGSSQKYGKEIYKMLLAENIRVELRDENESVGRKIRDAEMQKIPFMLVIGDKEVAAKSVAIRVPGDRKIKVQKTDKFIEDLKKKIASKK
jgi:threonyl-tRNA synthetase